MSDARADWIHGWAERLQHPAHTAALDAALIDVREALAEFGPAEATAQIMVDVAHWRQDTLSATFAMALVRLAKAETVEVTW